MVRYRCVCLRANASVSFCLQTARAGGYGQRIHLSMRDTQKKSGCRHEVPTCSCSSKDVQLQERARWYLAGRTTSQRDSCHRGGATQSSHRRLHCTSGSTYSPRLRLDPTRLAGPNPKVSASCTSKGELGLASHALLIRRTPLHDAVTDLRGDVGDGPGAVREEDGLCL